MRCRRMPHLLLVSGLFMDPAGAWGHIHMPAVASLEHIDRSLPAHGDLTLRADNGMVLADGKPVRKHRYKGRRTASKARSGGKRRSGAKASHGRKGGGMKRTGYASKAKARKKKKSFRSKPRTKRGASRGGRGR